LTLDGPHAKLGPLLPRLAAGFLAAGTGLLLALPVRNSNAAVPVPTITISPQHTETYRMTSSAMEPTIHCAMPALGCEAAQSDRVVVQKPVRTVKRGDIMLFWAPPRAARLCGGERLFIKRVIGLPGERWSERDGYVYINDKQLQEPYVSSQKRDSETHKPITIPPRHFFMMGDNRSGSCDSTRWGAVRAANLIGKVVEIQRSS
jgi:signal peptidase I